MNWTPIEEGLPEDEGEYITYSEEGRISINRFNPRRDKDYWYDDQHDSGHVTHWMELPHYPL